MNSFLSFIIFVTFSFVFIVYYRSNFFSLLKNLIFIFNYTKFILLLSILLILNINVYFFLNLSTFKFFNIFFIVVTGASIYFLFALSENKNLDAVKSIILKNMISICVLFFSVIFLPTEINNYATILLIWYLFVGLACFSAFNDSKILFIQYSSFLDANSKELYKLFYGILFYYYTILVFEKIVGFSGAQFLKILGFFIVLFITLFMPKYIVNKVGKKRILINSFIVINYIILIVTNYWSKLNAS